MLRLLNGHKDILLFSCFIVLALVGCGLVGEESACNAGDLGLIPGEGKGYPLQYSGLKNAMDCIVHGVTESDTTELLLLHFTSVLCETLMSKFILLSVWMSICSCLIC